MLGRVDMREKSSPFWGLGEGEERREELPLDVNKLKLKKKNQKQKKRVDKFHLLSLNDAPFLSACD